MPTRSPEDGARHAATVEEAASDRPQLLFFYSPISGSSRRTEGFLAQVLQRRRPARVHADLPDPGALADLTGVGDRHQAERRTFARNSSAPGRPWWTLQRAARRRTRCSCGCRRLGRAGAAARRR
jgi:hypothetical protein